MIINARWHQWETNSSSVHKIIIGEEAYKKPELVKFGVGEYGWGFDVLRTIDDRLSYIITLLVVNSRDGDEFKKWYDKLKDFLKSHDIEIDESAIYPHIYDEDGNIRKGKENIKEWDSSGRNIFGLECYVDHESCDNVVEVYRMLDNTDELFNFLFSGKSMVLIGNDNNDTVFEYDIDEAQETLVW